MNWRTKRRLPPKIWPTAGRLRCLRRGMSSPGSLARSLLHPSRRHQLHQPPWQDVEVSLLGKRALSRTSDRFWPCCTFSIRPWCCRLSTCLTAVESCDGVREDCPHPRCPRLLLLPSTRFGAEQTGLMWSTSGHGTARVHSLLCKPPRLFRCRRKMKTKTKTKTKAKAMATAMATGTAMSMTSVY